MLNNSYYTVWWLESQGLLELSPFCWWTPCNCMYISRHVRSSSRTTKRIFYRITGLRNTFQYRNNWYASNFLLSSSIYVFKLWHIPKVNAQTTEVTSSSLLDFKQHVLYSTQDSVKSTKLPKYLHLHSCKTVLQTHFLNELKCMGQNEQNDPFRFMCFGIYLCVLMLILI